VPLGEFGVVGDWLVRVDAVNRNADAVVVDSGAGNSPPSEGQRYLMVTVTVRYEGSLESSTPFDLTLIVEEADGSAHFNYSGECGFIPDELDDFAEVVPGAELMGNVCWSLPVDDIADAFLLVEDIYEGEFTDFDLG
jgi:hypothetical protein